MYVYAYACARCIRTSVSWLQQENNQNHFENNSYRSESDAGRSIRPKSIESADNKNGKQAKRTAQERKKEKKNRREFYKYNEHTSKVMMKKKRQRTQIQRQRH